MKCADRIDRAKNNLDTINDSNQDKLNLDAYTNIFSIFKTFKDHVAAFDAFYKIQKESDQYQQECEKFSNRACENFFADIPTKENLTLGSYLQDTPYEYMNYLEHLLKIMTYWDYQRPDLDQRGD